MACTVCNDLYPRSEGRRRESLVIPMQDCLRSTRTTSCDTCRLLRDIVEHFHVEDEDQIHVSGQSDQDDVLSVSIYADLDEDDVILSVFLPDGQESGHPLLRSSPNVRRVMPSSIDEQCFKKIEEWNTQCEEEHENCQSIWNLPPLPTRVIDVGLEGDEPYLMETNGKCEWYATLSYCWGTTPQLKTTKARLEEFKQALPMDELSLVARDAIEICQRLSISYLWIDALAIIQDSEEDRNNEIGNMCDIYANSYLTIAAAGTFDNPDGIFQDQSFGQQGRIASFSFRGQSVFARVNPFQDHLGHPLGLNFDQQYSDRLAEKSWLLRPSELPLVRRAWTVQERLLSRRVLYYTQEELWWECDSWWHCECGYADEEKYPANRDHQSFFRNMNATDIANRGSFDWLRDPQRLMPLTLDTAYRKWGTVIAMFAAGDLSYARDKLPALSGLAEQFKRLLKDRFDFEDTYLAGMWRRGLERQLLWVITSHVTGLKPLRPRAIDNSCPTWSWLSVSENVQFVSDEDDLNYTPRFRVIDISTDLASPYWAGEVKGGTLVIEAFVVHGVVVSESPSSKQNVVYIKFPCSESSMLFIRDTADDLTEGQYSCLYAADMDGADGIVETINTKVDSMVMLLKRSGRAQGAFERVGMGIAPAYTVTQGVWDDARREIITIV